MAGDRKYTVDTNLYVRAYRDPAGNLALARFHAAFSPHEFLTAVVVQELRAGARTAAAARQLQADLFDLFERRGRVITPSYAAWKQAGAVLAALAAGGGLEPGRVSKSFANDVLLAATCREAGVTLVTENRRDFERIAAVMGLEFVEGWPG